MLLKNHSSSNCDGFSVSLPINPGHKSITKGVILPDLQKINQREIKQLSKSPQLASGHIWMGTQVCEMMDVHFKVCTADTYRLLRIEGIQVLVVRDTFSEVEIAKLGHNEPQQLRNQRKWKEKKNSA